MDLVRAARQGNEAAFLELFDAHHAPLFRFAWRLTGSVADAEDIVQECFLALLDRDSAYDERRAPLRTYLFGAVRNQASKRLRRAVPHSEEELVDRRSPESGLLRDELSGAVREAIAGLPVTQREVLLLAHYEQLPLAEIARILNLNVGAVKSRLERARASLRETLAAFARTEESR